MTKAIVTLNKDLKSLKEKLHQQEMRCKMTDDGEIVANDFFEYYFSLSSQCCGYYIYWYKFQGKNFVCLTLNVSLYFNVIIINYCTGFNSNLSLGDIYSSKE